MSSTITVTLNGCRLEVAPGGTIAELLARCPHPGPFPALGAVAGTRLVGLYRKIRSQGTIRTIDRGSKEGMDIYRRTASILLYEAARRVVPGALVKIGQSIMGGYYFTVVGKRLTATLVKKIQANMRALADQDHPLRPRWIDVEAAIRIVNDDQLAGKAMLLEQEAHDETAVMDLDGATYQLFGPVAMSTGAIDVFSVTPYEGGLILHFPAYDSGKPVVTKPQPKLFATFRETQEWNHVVGCENVGQLNEHCKRGSISRLVKVAEALHEKKIASIADEIAKRHPATRLVLISGPSSSGKTTFSKRLEVQLEVAGLTPVTLSVDNYYVDRDKTPKNPDGTYNFEALDAVDLRLFESHVKRLIAGKRVEAPVFDFVTGKRHPKRKIPVSLGERGVLLVEGIHALNPRLTRGIPGKRKFRVFVSALTQLAIDEHNRIFTSDSRLLRRLVRDRLFRGYTAEQTLEGWASVRKGETDLIFPYQEKADVMFNSALVYEQAVLRPYAERFLREVPRTSPVFIEAARLLQFLAFFIPVLPEEVPHTSVLREFIGGSTFRY